MNQTKKKCTSGEIRMNDTTNNLKYISPLTGKPCKSRPCELLKKKRYASKYPDKVAQRKKKWLDTHPNYSSIYHKKHPKENNNQVIKNQRKYPDKLKARNKARYNTPKKLECEICGSRIDLEKHHPDYSKPKEVLTLCRVCHINQHRKGVYG